MPEQTAALRGWSGALRCRGRTLRLESTKDVIIHKADMLLTHNPFSQDSGGAWLP